MMDGALRAGPGEQHGIRVVEQARSFVHREATAIAALADQLDITFSRAVALLLATSGKVITTGAGTSGIVADRLAHLLSVSGTPAFYLPCGRALHGSMGAIERSDTMIAFSKGGRSDELNELMSRVASRGTITIAVTEQPGSPFAQAAALAVVIRTEPADVDLGHMIATGSTLVAGAWCDALVAAVMAARKYSWAEVLATHPAGAVGKQANNPTGGKHG